MTSETDGRLRRRWKQRREPVRLQAETHCVIHGRSPAEVWAFISAPESSILISTDVIAASVVPGTGPGVGEQHRTVCRTPGGEVVRVDTVTAYEECAFAEKVRDLGSGQFGTRDEVERAEGGTRLTAGCWVFLDPFDLPNDGVSLHHVSTLLDDYVARVKVLLEGEGLGGLIPAHPPSVTSRSHEGAAD